MRRQMQHIFFTFVFTFLGFGMGLARGLPKTLISFSKSTLLARQVSFCLTNLMFVSEKPILLSKLDGVVIKHTKN